MSISRFLLLRDRCLKVGTLHMLQLQRRLMQQLPQSWKLRTRRLQWLQMLPQRLRLLYRRPERLR